MKLSDLKYYLTIDKKPTSKEAFYENIVNEHSNEYTALLDSQVICIDIDDTQAREILTKAKDLGLLDDLTYSYKPTSNSFHFYFLKPKGPLKNKNTFLALGGFWYEYLDDKVVVFHPDNEYYNFDKDLTDINELFMPVAGTKADWSFKGVRETIANLQNAREGDKRSLNLFKLTNNINKRTSLSQSQLLNIYNFYNKVILKEPLSDNEVANNIDQVINGVKIDLDLDCQKFLVSDNKKIVLKNEEFCEELIRVYHFFQFNSSLYMFYDNKYVLADGSYGKIPDLLYFLISKIYRKINSNTDNSLKLDLNSDKYNEIKKILYKKSPLVMDNSLFHNKIRISNGLITILPDGEINYTFGDNYQDKTINHFDIAYNPLITTNNKIEQWLKEVFLRKSEKETLDQIDSFWEMVATCFVSHNFIRKAFILKGKGKNGKSTLINFIKKLVGSFNVSALTLDQINAQFMLNEMINKTVNINDEMLSTLNVDSHTFKTLISGGYLTTDVKHSDPKKWNNTATLIFASNNKLKVQKYHSAISDRLYIISLLNTFSGKNDIKNIEDTLLQSNEDYSYCLNKVLQALSRLIKNHWVLTQTKDSVRNLNDFINYNSPIRKFLISKRYVSMNDYETKLHLNTQGSIYFSQTDVINAYKDFNEWSDLNNGDNNKYKYGLERFKELLNDELEIETFFDINGNERFNVDKGDANE